jgi:hypothetical protein
VIFQGYVADELSNQDHEAEKVLPTAFDVIFLKALPPPQIARKSVKSVKQGSKWSCKVGKCKELYVVKWIFIVRLKKVHEFIVEKGKPRWPLIHEMGLRHQYHLVMNAHILNDV